MDISLKKRAKIIALKGHNFITVIDIAYTVSVFKSCVSRFLTSFKEPGAVSPKKKGRCGLKRKTTPRTDKIRDLLANSFDVINSTVQRRFLDAGRKARRLTKKLLTPNIKKKFRIDKN